MKKLLLILLCIPFIGLGQSVPQGINYQAVARDASSAVLMNQNLTIQFSVISDITTSAVSWQETHTVSTNDYGLYTVVIGGGISTNLGSSATFDSINWGASNHLLKVEVDYGGGFVNMGTTAFMSVPYALHSLNTDANLTGGALNDGLLWSDYLYWDNQVVPGQWKVASEKTHLGSLAGEFNQGSFGTAVGYLAGNDNQGESAVAIGNEAGKVNQSVVAVAIGNEAGQVNQGVSAVAIGNEAGKVNQATNSIVINATGLTLENTNANTFKIAPIAEGQNVNVLTYNTATSEVNYSTPPLVLPANSTNITTFGDRDLFDDGDVRIWLDDLTTDDIELEITNTFAPPGSVYHVSWTNFQSGGVGGATNVVDLNAGGVTSSTTLDFNFTTDEYMTIRIWSPAIGLTWGFYEIKIIKSNSLYTGIPVLCSVRKSF